MSRIVLTGASGFIGREVVPLLVAGGHEVHVLGRDRVAAAGARSHRCDLVDDDPTPLLQAIRPDGLIHLAWYAKPGAFWTAVDNLDWVAASLRLLRAFVANGGTRAVIAGSSAEYDWGFANLDERRTPLRPATLYGTAKEALGRLLAMASALPLSLGWARIFFPYGPHEQGGRLLGSVVDGIAAGMPVGLSAGTQARDFIHVEDVARALVMLFESGVEGPVNIATGEAVSIRELAMRAARIAGGEQLLRFGARPSPPGEPPYFHAAVDRLRREVGFSPRFDLEAGLRDAVRRRLSLA